MDYQKINRLFLHGFVVFLVLSAVLAIASLFAEEIGALQGRILATTFTISISSICAMAGAVFIERHNRTILGLFGITSSILGAALLIFGIWLKLENKIHFKSTVTLITLAFTFAHGFLLSFPTLDRKYSWVQKASALTIGALALQIVIAVWFEIEKELYFRFLAGLAILVGLETLTIPILLKLSKGKSKSSELILKQVENDLYKDSSGTLYEIKVVDPKDED